MELGTCPSTGNHYDFIMQSRNIISIHCIFAQAVLLFKSNLCFGNHRESWASGKFNYEMRFEQKDVVFLDKQFGIYFAGPSWTYFSFSHPPVDAD